MAGAETPLHPNAYNIRYELRTSRATAEDSVFSRQIAQVVLHSLFSNVLTDNRGVPVVPNRAEIATERDPKERAPRIATLVCRYPTGSPPPQQEWWLFRAGSLVETSLNHWWNVAVECMGAVGVEYALRRPGMWDEQSFGFRSGRQKVITTRGQLLAVFEEYFSANTEPPRNAKEVVGWVSGLGDRILDSLLGGRIPRSYLLSGQRSLVYGQYIRRRRTAYSDMPSVSRLE